MLAASGELSRPRTVPALNWPKWFGKDFTTPRAPFKPILRHVYPWRLHLSLREVRWSGGAKIASRHLQSGLIACMSVLKDTPIDAETY